jgi:hypothetical protein
MAVVSSSLIIFKASPPPPLGGEHSEERSRKELKALVLKIHIQMRRFPGNKGSAWHHAIGDIQHATDNIRYAIYNTQETT